MVMTPPRQPELDVVVKRLENYLNSSVHEYLSSLVRNLSPVSRLPNPAHLLPKNTVTGIECVILPPVLYFLTIGLVLVLVFLYFKHTDTNGAESGQSLESSSRQLDLISNTLNRNVDAATPLPVILGRTYVKNERGAQLSKNSSSASSSTMSFGEMVDFRRVDADGLNTSPTTPGVVKGMKYLSTSREELYSARHEMQKLKSSGAKSASMGIQDESTSGNAIRADMCYRLVWLSGDDDFNTSSQQQTGQESCHVINKDNTNHNTSDASYRPNKFYENPVFSSEMENDVSSQEYETDFFHLKSVGNPKSSCFEKTLSITKSNFPCCNDQPSVSSTPIEKKHAAKNRTSKPTKSGKGLFTSRTRSQLFPPLHVEPRLSGNESHGDECPGEPNCCGVWEIDDSQLWFQPTQETSQEMTSTSGTTNSYCVDAVEQLEHSGSTDASSCFSSSISLPSSILRFHASRTRSEALPTSCYPFSSTILEDVTSSSGPSDDVCTEATSLFAQVGSYSQTASLLLDQQTALAQGTCGKGDSSTSGSKVNPLVKKMAGPGRGHVTAEQRLSEFGFIKASGSHGFVVNPSPGKFYRQDSLQHLLDGGSRSKINTPVLLQDPEDHETSYVDLEAYLTSDESRYHYTDNSPAQSSADQHPASDTSGFGAKKLEDKNNNRMYRGERSRERSCERSLQRWSDLS
ncbi:uncharacterized protein LOC131949903 isoform X2 [Physella acuta]|uniref:uncharacterized protein LOC131949903 isoform X2 n=1 Tax=Physella acuta TaxID=109671 RepID=UPI0027DD2837|nr:uncharacterized protein LOC131949903 isoform X2 [Physella acuta]